MFSWLCWGLTSPSTIFQSCRDGVIASWVINQYFRGVKCLAQGHNTAEVGLEPRTSRSGVRHSTTEPPRSPSQCLKILFWSFYLRKNICNFSFFAQYIIQFNFYIWQRCKRLKHLGSVFVLLKTVLIVRSYVMLCEHSQESIQQELFISAF